MKELRSKILKALISALPITVIVYLLSLLPWFNFTAVELITFTIGAVFLALGMIVLFFLVCQIIFLKLPKRQLIRIGVGVIFTYIGFVPLPVESAAE